MKLMEAETRSSPMKKAYLLCTENNAISNLKNGIASKELEPGSVCRQEKKLL